MDFKKRIIVFIGLLWLTSATVANAHESLHKDLIVSVELVSAYPDQFGRIEIQVSYENPTSQSIKVLRRGTALDGGVFTDLLNVSLDGRSLAYIGPVFKRLKPDVSDFVTIPAYQSVSETVEIQDAYDFSKIGLYTVTAKQHANRKAEVIQSPVLIAVSSPPIKPKRPPTFAGCSDSQRRASDDALLWAERYAINARNALSSTPAQSRPRSPRYTTWYGNYDLTRWNRVQSNWNKIASTLTDKTIAYNCACDAPGVDQSDTVAYVYPSRPYEINLCPIFFRLRTTGTNSQAGVVIHEVSHFSIVSGTKDHVYGTSGAKNLARSSPARAIENADSYEYFGENPGNLPMIDSGGGSNPLPGDDDNPIIEPDPEQPGKPDYSFISTINNYLLDDALFVLPPHLTMPDSPVPALPEKVEGKFSFVMERSGFWDSEPNVTTKYEYSQLNSNFTLSSPEPPEVFAINLYGEGVVGGGVKRSNSWTVRIGAKPDELLRPGIYAYASTSHWYTGHSRPFVYLSGTPCASDPIAHIRVYEAEYNDDNSIARILLDFYIACHEDRQKKVRGTILYDRFAADPSITVENASLDEADLYPYMAPLVNYGAKVTVLKDNIFTQEAASYIVKNEKLYDLLESYSESGFRLNPVSLRHDFHIDFEYPRLDLYQDQNTSLAREYSNILDGALPGVVLGNFDFVMDGNRCDFPVSQLKIYDAKPIGSEPGSRSIGRLVMDFEKVCQVSGDRYRGSFMLDRFLPKLEERSISEVEEEVLNPALSELVGAGARFAIQRVDHEVKYFETPSSLITVHSPNRSKIYINVEGDEQYYFSFDLSNASTDGELEIRRGVYEPTTGQVTDSGTRKFELKGSVSPVGLHPVGKISGCDFSDIGRIAVHDIEFDDSDQVIKLMADFEIRGCPNSYAPLGASIRYDYSNNGSSFSTPEVLGVDEIDSLPTLQNHTARVKMKINGVDADELLFSREADVSLQTKETGGGFKLSVANNEFEIDFNFDRATLAGDNNRGNKLSKGRYSLAQTTDGSQLGWKITGEIPGGPASFYHKSCDYFRDISVLKIYEIEYVSQSDVPMIDKIDGKINFNCEAFGRPGYSVYEVDFQFQRNLTN